jgi:hypothetical protein
MDSYGSDVARFASNMRWHFFGADAAPQFRHMHVLAAAVYTVVEARRQISQLNNKQTYRLKRADPVVRSCQIPVENEIANDMIGGVKDVR